MLLSFDISSRLTTTTSPPLTTNVNQPPLNLANNFEAQLKLNSAVANNPFMLTQNQQNTSFDPTTTSHQFPAMSDPFRAASNDVAMTGGYQKLPFRAAQTSTVIENNEVDLNGFMGAKYNRLYTQSPQLPRKVYNDPVPNNTQHFHPHASPLMHHLGRESPMMPRKFPPREQEMTATYSPFKPLPFQPNNSPSPMMRRRYQEGGVGHPVSDEEYRILHGNTSPIVLQRFYHQQNQLREQDQLRDMRLNSSSPFGHNSPAHTSSIPIKCGGSPLPAHRYHYQPPSTVAYRFQQQQEPLPNYHHASHIPQLQSNRYMSNGNGNSNGIPYKHHPQHQIVYDNVANRPQVPCPGSPQLDRLRANMEKINFYERNQKLPVESSYQLEMNRQNGDLNGSGDLKNKDKQGENYFDFICKFFSLLLAFYSMFCWPTVLHLTKKKLLIFPIIFETLIQQTFFLYLFLHFRPACVILSCLLSVTHPTLNQCRINQTKLCSCLPFHTKLYILEHSPTHNMLLVPACAARGSKNTNFLPCQNVAHHHRMVEFCCRNRQDLHPIEIRSWTAAKCEREQREAQISGECLAHSTSNNESICSNATKSACNTQSIAKFTTCESWSAAKKDEGQSKSVDIASQAGTCVNVAAVGEEVSCWWSYMNICCWFKLFYVSCRLISPSPPPPMIPPRGIKYNSDSVPASPQHLQTRINYTPEPQRRYFRPLDQWELWRMWSLYRSSHIHSRLYPTSGPL